MAETIFRGPAASLGSLFDGRIEAMDGPGLEYQANAFPDARYFPARKDGLYPGRIPAFLNSPFSVIVDQVPSTALAGAVAARQNTTSGTPLTLVTVAAGGTAAGVPSVARVPLVPSTGGLPVTVDAIDFGFTTGNITAGSATVTVPDSTLFALGQWVCIGGAGNSAKTASLFAQVIAAPTATTITLSTASLGTLTNAPIGNTNLTGGAYWPPNTPPTGAFPYNTAGLASLFNPIEGLTRAVSVTGVASGTGGTFILRGYDIYGFAMSENIVATAGATPGNRQNAWKYIQSITPQFTDAHNYSFNTIDIVGLNLRSLKWEFLNIFYNGTFVTTTEGWTAAVTTNPATATTGDVRGTYTLASAADATKRLTISMSVTQLDDILATPQNAIPLFGVPQFTQ